MATKTAAVKARRSKAAPAIQLATAAEGERVVKAIPLKLIDPSPFETQAHRRARFTDTATEELAEDIRVNTLIHPITVRPVKKRYEIVVGERRFLAVSKLGRTTIDATVIGLTDAEAFERQQSENAKREDNHPVDDALAYKFMSDHFGYDIEEIAVRRGQTPSFVACRLQLLRLAPVVLKAVDEGKVMLGHALEIAKHPKERHQELLDLCYSSRGHETEGLVSVRVFIERIQKNFLHRLDHAPFSPTATHLRADGLACKECTSRTSANRLLFSEGYNPKDQCLDPQCWKDKEQMLIQIQRAAVVVPDRDVSLPLTADEFKKADEVPILADEQSYGPDRPANLINKWDYTEVKKNACENVETGVLFNGSRTGQAIYFCRAPRCPKHKGKGYISQPKDPDKARDERLDRKEELIDVRVADAVRLRVFKDAAVTFGKNAQLLGVGNEFLPWLLGKLVATSNNGDDAHTLERVIKPLLKEWEPTFVDELRSNGEGYGQSGKAEAYRTLDEEIARRVLFLFVHGNKGEMYYDQCKSQQDVRNLAEEYGLDYALMDAEERLKYSMEKHKKHVEHYRQYHEAIKDGRRNTAIPRLYSVNYKTKA